MAQNFYCLLGVGDNNTTITTIDSDGVTLAAIKALCEKSKHVDELEVSNEGLKEELAQLRAFVQKWLEQCGE